MRLHPAACGTCHHFRLPARVSEVMLCYLLAESPSLQAVSPGWWRAAGVVAASHRGRVSIKTFHKKDCTCTITPLQETYDVHSNARIGLHTSKAIITPPCRRFKALAPCPHHRVGCCSDVMEHFSICSGVVVI